MVQKHLNVSEIQNVNILNSTTKDRDYHIGQKNKIQFCYLLYIRPQRLGNEKTKIEYHWESKNIYFIAMFILDNIKFKAMALIGIKRNYIF